MGNESLCRELAYTGRTFGAVEAAAMGFVSRVVTAAAAGSSASVAVAVAPSRRADVVDASLLTASEIARQSPVAVFGTKRNLMYARDHSVGDGLEYAATWSGAALQAGDLGTAMRAAAVGTSASSSRRNKNGGGTGAEGRAGAGAGAGLHPRFSKL